MIWMNCILNLQKYNIQLIARHLYGDVIYGVNFRDHQMLMYDVKDGVLSLPARHYDAQQNDIELLLCSIKQWWTLIGPPRTAFSYSRKPWEELTLHEKRLVIEVVFNVACDNVPIFTNEEFQTHMREVSCKHGLWFSGIPTVRTTNYQVVYPLGPRQVHVLEMFCNPKLGWDHLVQVLKLWGVVKPPKGVFIHNGGVAFLGESLTSDITVEDWLSNCTF